jgi:hypothetical protein
MSEERLRGRPIGLDLIDAALISWQTPPFLVPRYANYLIRLA